VTEGSVESDYQMLPDPRLRMLSKLPLRADTFTSPDWSLLGKIRFTEI
jgi:hypothetical protein